MPRTKVTRNRQVTIPSEIAASAHIMEGDILDVAVVGNDVVFRKASETLPLIRIGRRISDAEVELLIAVAAQETSR